MSANKNKVFISAPISLDWGTFMEFVRAVVKIVPGGSEVHFWDRQEEYDREKFDSCDTVIFLLPDNKFEAGFGEFSAGLRAELRRAYGQSKNILIGRKADNGHYLFYNTETNGQYIKGIAGTSGALDRIVEITEKFIKNATRIAQNSTYGMNGTFVQNPCDELRMEHVGTTITLAITYEGCVDHDERLLLML